ncbi:mechanosensitive ion channel domain-containing protein [Escherichia coli]
MVYKEIFGNFVSGLIILFERPVRIGDTVTIGSFSGTVMPCCGAMPIAKK